jgi:pilus assembly protein CpaC
VTTQIARISQWRRTGWAAFGLPLAASLTISGLAQQTPQDTAAPHPIVLRGSRPVSTTAAPAQNNTPSKTSAPARTVAPVTHGAALPANAPARMPTPASTAAHATAPAATSPSGRSLPTAASAPPNVTAPIHIKGPAASGVATTVGAAVAAPVSAPPANPSPTGPAYVAPAAFAVAGANVGAHMVADFSTPPSTEQTIHLQVGHSIFVNTKHRLSRVYVTNPTVLDSYTANPNQIVVTAKEAGVSTLILWDEQGDSQVYMVSADADVENLRRALLAAYPHDDIQVKASEGRITLTGFVGTKDTVDAAGKIAALYAKDFSNALIVNSSHVRQVRLKVRFVEVDRSKLAQFGFSFFSLNGSTLVTASTLQFPNTLQVGSSTSGTAFPVGGTQVSIGNPLNFMLYSAKYNVGVALQDLATRQLLQILAEPTITAMSGQKANFLAGGEFPFPVVQGASQGFTSVSIQFRPFGVKLEFTPVVNPDDSIDLSISPEVSALDYTNAVSISGYTVPAISTRRAQTEVVLRSGQSFALTGLLDRRTTDAYERTPGIASVPIIGALFRSKSLNHSLSELVVVVTPEIIDPLKDADQPIAEPHIVVPFIDRPSFDQSMKQKEKKDQPQQ